MTKPVSRATWDANVERVNREYANQPVIRDTILARFAAEFQVTDAPAQAALAPKPAGAAPGAPSDAPAVLSRSEAVAARNQRIADGIATDDDLPFMSATQLREHLAAQHAGTLTSTQPEYTDERTTEQLLADLAAEKAVAAENAPEPVNLERSQANAAAKRRREAAEATRAEQIEAITSRNPHLDRSLVEGMVPSVDAILQATEPTPSGVEKAVEDVRAAFAALQKGADNA